MGTAFRVVVPARRAATRLPDKPLRLLGGEPLVRRVARRALECGAEEVLVAVDDPEVAAVLEGLPVRAVMTSPRHRSGTERIAEVAGREGWPDGTIVVNVQGDEPFLPPSLPQQAAEALAARPEADVATLCTPLLDGPELADPHVVKVVLDAQGFALYFSRAPVPWHREGFAEGVPPLLPAGCPWWRHVGLYAYRAGFLRRYAGWGPAPVEQAEALEQLRALWHGARIYVDEARELPGPGIDTEADLLRAEAILRAGG